jgi:hypothetical protein
MSRRFSWLIVVALAIIVTVTLIVMSRQSVEEKSNSNWAAFVPMQEKPTPQNPAEVPDKPKEICTLHRDQSPDIGGLKLGMTSQQVLGFFPGSEQTAEVRMDLNQPPTRFGETRFAIRPDAYASKANYEGIRMITFTFLDGRVSDMNVTYNGPEWKNVDEFVAKFSKGKTLPDAWEAYPGMDTLKMLKCDGFEVSVFAGGKGGSANYVQIKDMIVDKEFKARRQKAREKAQKEAKPN